MKLIRFGKAGAEKPGIIVNDRRLDVSKFIQDYNEFFFASGVNNFKELVADNLSQFPEVAAHERWGSPVARPSKIVCIGLNYAKHAKETNAPVPAEPIIFLKSTTAIVGPYDDITIPKDSEKTDWEVELAIVIGKKASYVSEENAMEYVAGYCLHNDVSERAFQLERGGTWDKGKGCDTFAPLGPWMATADEINDVHHLRLWLSVNGVMRQDGNTDDFIFTVPEMVSYISRFMTLLPGDIISTGTPHGVGLGFTPPIFLKEGDVIELGIDGLGTSQQLCKAWSLA